MRYGSYRLTVRNNEYRYLVNPVDLTDYNKIVFTISDETNLPYSGITRYVGVSKTVPTSFNNANSNTTKIGGTITSQPANFTVFELDVSRLSGEYYLFWTSISTDTRYETRIQIVSVELK